MDFREAIKAHSMWKIKLIDYIKSNDHNLVPENVGKDNQCPLGQWIYGEGQAYKDIPEFGKLLESHKLFHKEASMIVEKINNGEEINKEQLLGTKSPYDRISLITIQNIMSIQRKVSGLSY